eukprot:c17917_g1_i1.p1 GENE.c17917_g1_i1~~c17917_g1_i1.p1  ORF type:complete len:588 (-),score=181.36 c17917_g1_i1:6-1769(-)
MKNKWFCGLFSPNNQTNNNNCYSVLSFIEKLQSNYFIWKEKSPFIFSIIILLIVLIFLAAVPTNNYSRRWINFSVFSCVIIIYKLSNLSFFLSLKQNNSIKLLPLPHNIRTFLNYSKFYFHYIFKFLLGIGLFIIIIFQLVADPSRVRAILGIIFTIIICCFISSEPTKINFQPVLSGLTLQLCLGIIILHTSFGFIIFEWLGERASRISDFGESGKVFVFGNDCIDDLTWKDDFGNSCSFYKLNGCSDVIITNNSTISLSIDILTHCRATCGICERSTGLWQIAPAIIFFSSAINVLYHIGVMQIVMMGFCFVFSRLLKVSGAEALVAAANIFVGHTSTFFMIKPYLPKLTKSELMSIMATGFATVSGGMLGGYISLGLTPRYLIAASVMASPSALAISKIICPETETPETKDSTNLKINLQTINILDAVSIGAMEGVGMSLGIFGGLIAFLGLIDLTNDFLGWFELSLSLLLGYIFYPFAWFSGVPEQDISTVAILFGEKIVFNELVAYQHMTSFEYGELTKRGSVISTFILCGFSNIAGIGIQISALRTVCPERSADTAKMGFTAMVCGVLATFLTGCVAALFV